MYRNGLLAILAVALMVFGWQNRRLRSTIGEVGRREHAPRAGVRVPELTLLSNSGDTVTLGAPKAGHRQLLIAMAATCPYCAASQPAWRRLLTSVDSMRHVETIGVALDSIQVASSYVHESRLLLPVVSLPPRWWTLFRMRRVPLLLVIDDQGMTTYARAGALISTAGTDSVIAALAAPSAKGADGEQASRRAPGPISGSD